MTRQVFFLVLSVAMGQSCAQSGNWAMVVGGFGSLGPSRTPELISLDPANHPVPDCLASLNDFPETVHSAAGASLDRGLPHVCGGYSAGEYSADCYRYDPMADSWIKSGEMLWNRYLSGYDYSPTLGLVMAGGGYPVTTMIEATLDGAAFEADSVADLPIYNWDFCFASVGNGSDLISIGGSGFNDQLVYRHSGAAGVWEQLPNTLQSRYGSGCGLVIEDGKRYIVAVGGGYVGPSDTSEVLDLDTMQWSEGPSLPHILSDMRKVQWGNTFALVGGWDGNDWYDTVYLFDPAAKDWVLLEEQLSRPRGFVTAFLVDENIFPEC